MCFPHQVFITVISESCRKYQLCVVLYAILNFNKLRMLAFHFVFVNWFFYYALSRIY